MFFDDILKLFGGASLVVLMLVNLTEDEHSASLVVFAFCGEKCAAQILHGLVFLAHRDVIVSVNQVDVGAYISRDFLVAVHSHYYRMKHRLGFLKLSCDDVSLCQP